MEKLVAPDNFTCYSHSTTLARDYLDWGTPQAHSHELPYHLRHQSTAGGFITPIVAMFNIAMFDIAMFDIAMFDIAMFDIAMFDIVYRFTSHCNYVESPCIA